MFSTKRHEFLRDRDQPAARMKGTIKADDVDTEFESVCVRKDERADGKLARLIERSVWDPAGGAMEYGIKQTEPRVTLQRNANDFDT